MGISASSPADTCIRDQGPSPGPGAIVGGGAGDFAGAGRGAGGGVEADPGSNLAKLGLPGKVTECRKKASTFFRAKILVAEVEYSVAS